MARRDSLAVSDAVSADDPDADSETASSGPPPVCSLPCSVSIIYPGIPTARQRHAAAAAEKIRRLIFFFFSLFCSMSRFSISSGRRESGTAMPSACSRSIFSTFSSCSSVFSSSIFCCKSCSAFFSSMFSSLFFSSISYPPFTSTPHFPGACAAFPAHGSSLTAPWQDCTRASVRSHRSDSRQR